jgi:hypothetical protein
MLIKNCEIDKQDDELSKLREKDGISVFKSTG